MAKNATVADLFKKKPATRTINIVFDSELAERWQKAQAEYEQAKMRYDNSASSENLAALNRATEEFEDIEAEYDANAVAIVVQSIGDEAYDALKAEHPATREQNKEARKTNPLGELAWNPDTFPKALFAASVIVPEMTAEQVDELFSHPGYNPGELDMLKAAAIEVNQNSRAITVGKGSGVTRGFGKS